MEHYLRVAGVVGVKNVRETKDKQGMPSGKCSITASYEGGKIEFMVPKEMGVVVGDVEGDVVEEVGASELDRKVVDANHNGI